MVNVLTGLSNNRKLRIMNSQESKNIKKFGKCAVKNTINVLTNLSKNIRNWKILSQIFTKNEIFTKCADKYSKKLKHMENELTKHFFQIYNHLKKLSMHFPKFAFKKLSAQFWK